MAKDSQLKIVPKVILFIVYCDILQNSILQS